MFGLTISKAVADISKKNIVYDLSDELSNNLRFSILGNWKVLGK